MADANVTELRPSPQREQAVMPSDAAEMGHGMFLLAINWC
jgi:hypothetical protein